MNDLNLLAAANHSQWRSNRLPVRPQAVRIKFEMGLTTSGDDLDAVRSSESVVKLRRVPEQTDVWVSTHHNPAICLGNPHVRKLLRY
jgi:hypothetical protein